MRPTQRSPVTNGQKRPRTADEPTPTASIPKYYLSTATKLTPVPTIGNITRTAQTAADPTPPQPHAPAREDTDMVGSARLPRNEYAHTTHPPSPAVRFLGPWPSSSVSAYALYGVNACGHVCKTHVVPCACTHEHALRASARTWITTPLTADPNKEKSIDMPARRYAADDPFSRAGSIRSTSQKD